MKTQYVVSFGYNNAFAFDSIDDAAAFAKTVGGVKQVDDEYAGGKYVCVESEREQNLTIALERVLTKDEYEAKKAEDE